MKRRQSRSSSEGGNGRKGRDSRESNVSHLEENSASVHACEKGRLRGGRWDPGAWVTLYQRYAGSSPAVETLYAELTGYMR